LKSLNQIIAELEAFATAHYQIHAFGHGDVWEISPQSDRIVYPLLWMVPQTATPSLREVTQTFTVLCMDLVDSGERNETEVLSDTQQIILDVCSYYRQQHDQDYIIEFGGQIQSFTEAHPERVSGNSISITIRQPFEYNACAIPAAPIAPAPPPCLPATFTLINTAVPPATLGSGSIPSGGDLPIIAPPATVRLVDTDDNELLQDSVPSGVMTDVTAPDATLKLNNSLTTYPIRSGELYNMLVRLNGQVPQTFSYTPGTKTLNVISPPCADGSVEINGDFVANVASGGMVNIMVEQDGNPVGAFDPNSNSWVIPPCGAGGSVSVSVSNATPDFGDIITITATPTGFTPTSYLYLAFDGVRMIPISTVNPDDNITTWQVSLFGSVAIYAIATDGTTRSWGSIDVTVASDADAAAYILATGITDPDQIMVANMLVTGWKNIGVWNTTLAMYPIMGGTAARHKFNLKNPADSDAAFRLSIFGGWTHDAMGMLGNGSNAYANTHLIPSANLTSSNNSVMLYVNQGTAESKYDFMTTSDAGGAFNGFGLISQYFATGISAFYITNEFLSVVVANPLGMTMGFTDSGTKRLYKDASQIASDATASSSLSNLSMYLGANNGGGTAGFYANKRYCFAAVFSAGMTQAQAVAAYNLVQACQIILGRQA
jgi:hypothetical protein